MDTFPQLIRAAAAEFGEDTAIALKGEVDESLSFRALDEQSAELARGLMALGLGKGARVGFIFGNGPGFALALAAIARIGAVAVPISTMIRANELVRVLRQSDVAGLILQRSLLGHDYVQRICEALPELRATPDPELRLPQLPYLRWIFCTGPDLPPAIRDIAYLREAAETVHQALLHGVEAEIHATDQMIEIYTSGSMALPKGVKHSHGAVMFRTRWLQTMARVERGQNITVPLPMFWVGGLMMYLLPNWLAGATTICTEKTMASSRFAIGSVMAEEDLRSLPKMQVIWALGMSETLGPYSHGDEMRAPGYPLCAPLDHIAEGFEVRIADAQGRELPEGERGEIQVRGYPLTQGLHKLPREPYFTPDGFYRTGDMGHREGRRIHFTGRDGDMIKTAGANVSPAEVELELQALPGVHSAYVLGLPDKERGQLVVAALVPREGAELDVKAIEQTLRQKLSGYKVPRDYVVLAREDVPLLPSNKVARREIERLLGQRLGHNG